ncbi:MAG: hypothetical protein IPN55_00750 [Saprospiraceae bacterium]|nr:hypothetical protein [Candidatus Brachybacter algidus]
MKRAVLISGLVLMTSLLFHACSGPSKEKVAVVSTDTLQAEEEVMSEEELKIKETELWEFLISTEGTYGWETKTDKISLDFFEDGRLHIQGPDGEATMWEGSWKLKGDRLSMVRPDLKSTETESVSIDGDKLMIGAVEYTRYKAE